MVPDAVKEAEEFLKNSGNSQKRFARVSHLIDGFETPYGMELLASVHWVASSAENERRIDENQVVEQVHSWNEHKKIFRPDHLKTAWKRLSEEGWI
jgi:hypothetical protein